MLAVLKMGDALYQVVYLLHILSAIVAFAPVFVWPIVNAQTRKRGATLPADVTGQAAVNNVTVHGPALIATGVFGLLMVVLSDEIYKFSQAWISIAFVLWFALIGVMFGLLTPAQRKAAAGDEGAAKKVPMFGGFVHILLLLILLDMVFKPGSGL